MSGSEKGIGGIGSYARDRQTAVQASQCEPCAPPEISEEIISLTNNTELLMNAVKELSARLSPILRPHNDKPENHSCPTRNTGLGRKIQEENMKIIVCIEVMRVLQITCEL